MRWHKHIRAQRDGVDLEADINAVIAINQGDPGATTRAESVSRARVDQDPPREAESASAQEPPQQPPADRRANEKEQPNEQ